MAYRTNARSHVFVRLVIAATLGLGFAQGIASCSGDGGTGTTPPPSGSPCTSDLASIQDDIFTPSCATAGCHVGANAAGGLDLTGDVVQALVDVPSATCPSQILVVPGAPADSMLFKKIAGTPPCGASMPMGKSLTQEEIACVEKWIAGLEPTTDGGTDAPCTNCGCSAGQTACGGACVDLNSDPANCGSCGNACSGGKVCANGGCTSACPMGTSDCNGSCVDTKTDANNCGTCGIACSNGEPCMNGSCGCPGGGTPCNGSCEDTQTSNDNCGACGNTCAVGQTCVNGSCSCGQASVSFSAAVQPIFTASCLNAGCHGGIMPAGGLNLKQGQSYSSLVNVSASQCNDGRKRVLPGDPSKSYLIDKVMGVDLCFGTQMPKAGSLPQGQIQTIADWICSGAPNN